MKIAVIAGVIILGAAALPPRPVYSAEYATVFRQGSVSSERVPQTGRGPPQENKSTTENIAEITTESESEQIKVPEEDVVKDKLTEATEADSLEEEAVYYIYHPGGVLQRVVYSARNDPRNMAYTARFKYENVEPVKEPIYTYGPETLVWVQLQR